MSAFEPRVIELDGRRWAVPRLPWRLSRQVQPALLHTIKAVGGAGVSSNGIAALVEADLDRLADAIFLTIAYVDPTMTRADFDNLPIGFPDLLDAFRAACECAGMRMVRKEGETDGPKAVTSSTGTS